MVNLTLAQGSRLNTQAIMMIERGNNLGYGNKKIAQFSAAALILLALILLISDFSFLTFGFVMIMLAAYSSYAAITHYIHLQQNKFIIQNLFKKDVEIDLELFKDIEQLLPFHSLMRIHFHDGKSFLFYGKSEAEIRMRISLRLRS